MNISNSSNREETNNLGGITFTFQQLISNIQKYWACFGCTILQPLDVEIGAGTFHHATFLRAITEDIWNVAYVQPCRRPTDGRYSCSPNRSQYYYQFQVILKPAPIDIVEVYVRSLESIGIKESENDIRFLEDNWESPTLSAYGSGWEVRLNGIEITQFTYFQQIGGIECNNTTVEITYGLERIAMYLQDTDNMYDIKWNNNGTTYGDIMYEYEIQFSKYNFEIANIDFLQNILNMYAIECQRLIDSDLVFPAYEMLLHSSHIFNVLDARGAISTNSRKELILSMQKLAKTIYRKHISDTKSI